MSASVFTKPDPELSIADLALSWIDHDVRPRLVVSNRLSIVWTNAAARAALARRVDMESRNGVLSTTHAGAQSALVNFILDSGAAVSCWCLPRANDDGFLLLRSQRISWAGFGFFGVSFIGSGSDFKARYADLDTAFCLTRSEHEVLLQLLDGQDVDSIADNRFVSIETIRSQVRQIYAKLNVRTREGLFRRALPFLL